MAYGSKAERRATWRDYCHDEWVRSLPAVSTRDLEANLLAIQIRLRHEDRRHVYVIANMEANATILERLIAKRKEVAQ